ncbi:hypothetical protein Dimus_002228 [Dionaea muscipula]
MASEYGRFGTISAKSDVFSFGVLLLEIVPGRKNISYRSPEHVENLLSYVSTSHYPSIFSIKLFAFRIQVWKYWKKKRILKLIDPVLRDGGLIEAMTQCIHIGLLCVAENAVDRPTLAAVGLILDGHNQSLLPPSPPAFLMHISGSTTSGTSMVDQPAVLSVNEVSWTEPYGR